MIFRESFNNAALAEVDAHFCLDRVKEAFAQVQEQVANWQLENGRDYELKISGGARIQLPLSCPGWKDSFVS